MHHYYHYYYLSITRWSFMIMIIMQFVIIRTYGIDVGVSIRNRMQKIFPTLWRPDTRNIPELTINRWKVSSDDKLFTTTGVYGGDTVWVKCNLDRKLFQNEIKIYDATIAQLHKLKIAHGDIKLENIMIVPSTPTTGWSSPSIFLANFEYAIQLDSVSSMQTPPRGTPGHRPPEAYVGKDPELSPPKVDMYKYDSWSLGVLMYAVLLNQYPYSTGTLDTNNRWVAWTSTHHLIWGMKHLVTMNKHTCKPIHISPVGLTPEQVQQLHALVKSTTSLMTIRPMDRPTPTDLLNRTPWVEMIERSSSSSSSQ
ncbi:kinase-like domain-containing protein [Syncephalis plumigaleata]|nr:kinase-like domain-containing protein [Syncephalis plumigaleata]